MAKNLARALWLAKEGEPSGDQNGLPRWHDWHNLPEDARQLEGILWTDPEYYQGDSKLFCRELASRLGPAGTLHLQTRIIPATRLRGRKGREVAQAATYLNAFHRFLAPGTRDAVSQYIWQKWLTEAGFTIEKLEVEDKLTNLRLHPSHSHKDFVRLKVLLIHAPEVAKQRLTPYVADDRIQFHVYQANFVCRLKNYE